MRQKTWGLALLCAALLVLALLPLGDTPAAEESVRPPCVAGMFYSASPEKLTKQIKGFLAEADPQVPEDLKNERPCALVVPHAGYTYSGQTAAFAYKLLQGRKRPSRVVLLGPSHRVHMDGVSSVSPYTKYRTPLGDLPVDVEARRALLRSKLFVSHAAAHRDEHSLEVQMPFLQVIWDDPPPILPIVVGDLDAAELEGAAKALKAIVDGETLLIASTDFTHYGERFRYAPFAPAKGDELAAKIKDLDMGAAKKIQALDGKGLLEYCRKTGATICGRVPTALLLQVLSEKENIRGVQLHYASSADATGSYRDSVSYYAHAFYYTPQQAE